jgi:hypothetical protein
MEDLTGMQLGPYRALALSAKVDGASAAYQPASMRWR